MFTIQEIIAACSATPLRRGRACAVSGVSIDSRSIPAGSMFIAIKGRRCDGHAFIAQALKKGARCLLVERGAAGVRIPANAAVWVLEVADTTRALGDLARFHRLRFDIPVIAVTGSNGKTTTKEMLATLLARRYTVLRTEGTQNNHIGLPMTLLRLRPRHQAAVLELGTNHFGEIAYLGGICLPTMCVITAIGPSHLEFFKSVAGVAREKLSLLRFLRPPAVALLNADDPLLARSAVRSAVRSAGSSPAVITYGLKQPADFRARVFCGAGAAGAGVRFSVHGSSYSLPALGEHNVSNALAALAICRLLGMSRAELRRGMKQIRLPAGRLQLRKAGGINFIDDSYNANPFSLSQALRCFRQLPVAGRKIVVMGDMLEMGKQSARFHRQAGREAAAFCDCLICVGTLSQAAAVAARRAGMAATAVLCCADSGQASRIVASLRPGKNDLVLVKGSRGMHLETIFETPAASKR